MVPTESRGDATEYEYESGVIGVLAAVIPRICSTGRFKRRIGPDGPTGDGWNDSFVRLHDRISRISGCRRPLPILDTTLECEKAQLWAERIGQDRIGRVDQCDCMGAQPHCPAWAEPWIRPGGAGIG